jgi:hypothetical protein
VRFNEHIELDGAIVFEHACKRGLEGIVTKRRHSLPFRVNEALDQDQEPASPAMLRVQDGTFLEAQIVLVKLRQPVP